MSEATTGVAGLRREREPAATGAGIPAPPRRWRTRVLLPAGLLVAFAGVIAFAARDALWPRRGVEVVPVVVTAVAADAPGAVTSQAAGWLEPDPFPIRATALAEGVIEEMLVLEGDRVEKGQVIARMVADDARLALARAEADLRDRQADLEAAVTEWDHPFERERQVAVAAAERDLAAGELAAAEAQVAIRKAEIAEVEERLRTERGEFAGDAISRFAVTRTELELETRRAQARLAVEQRDRAAAGVRRAAAVLAAAEEAAQRRIPETRARAAAQAATDRATAARDEAALRLERMAVRAPADGIVMRRLVEPGAKVRFAMDSPYSAHVAHLYDPAHLQVRVDVPFADAGGVGVGHRARVTVEVLPERTFEGVVTRVVHEADIQKNTLQVKVAIEDPDPALKPEMLARVQFVSGGGAPKTGDAPVSERVFAPERLLDRSAGGVRAWIVDPDGDRARARTIEIGRGRRDGWVEVLSGLRPGDRLIDVDPATLEDGLRVTITGESRDGGR